MEQVDAAIVHRTCCADPPSCSSACYPALLPAPLQLRCLSAFGGAIPTTPRRHIGRCVPVNGMAYSLNASSPEDRWDEVGPLLRAVVATFRK